MSYIKVFTDVFFWRNLICFHRESLPDPVYSYIVGSKLGDAGQRALRLLYIQDNIHVVHTVFNIEVPLCLFIDRRRSTRHQISQC